MPISNKQKRNENKHKTTHNEIRDETENIKTKSLIHIYSDSEERSNSSEESDNTFYTISKSHRKSKRKNERI